MDNQCDAVLSYIERNGKITALDACIHIGCTRLSNVILNLRRKKIPIITEMQTHTNSFGVTKRYGVYRMDNTIEKEVK